MKPVLCNILEANGANDLVKNKRGVKHQKIQMEKVIKKMQQQNDIETVDLLEDDIIVDENDDQINDIGMELIDM